MKKLMMIMTSILACQTAISSAAINNPALTGTFAKAQGAETNSTAPFPSSFTPISETDLANSDQPSFLNISNIDTGGAANNVSRLFDGVAAVGSSFEAQFNSGSFTINFDTSNSVYGYDVIQLSNRRNGKASTCSSL